MKGIIIAVVGILMGINAFSQDVHFSDLNMNNYYTSIASIGSSSADFRAATFYRNQWPTIGNTYQTIGMAVDYKMELDKNNLGFGLIMNRDQSGDLNFTRLQVDGVFAYHKRVSRYSFLSGGIQGGITQHKIDETNGEWQNQYNGKEHDPNLPSLEPALFQPFMTYNLGAGVMWEYNNSQFNRYSMTLTKLNLGVSLYHLAEPGLVYNGNEPEYTRIAFTGSSDIVLESGRSALSPAFLFQLKGKEKEFVFGTLYTIIIREESKYTGYYDRLDISFGAYYRLPNDALIPAFNMSYNSFEFGMTYGANISPLITASNSIGGLEFTLKYLFRN